MAEQQDQFAQHAAAVARDLFGDPNKALSSTAELRFGAQGSISVDVKTGQFFDHEQKEGGGVLWAIEHQTGQTIAGGKAVEWMRSNGFDIEDNRPPPPRANGGARLDPAGNFLPNRVPDNGRLTASYDYRAANDTVAYQVCRYDWEVPKDKNPKGHEKTFVQRRPDDSKKNGWTYSTKGLMPLPYRLPELIEDVAQGFPVYIVEGEKKVDMLRAIGVPATCNHGGAGKFPEPLLEWFRDARVILLPDNDDAGRKHVDLIGRRLQGVAKTIHLLDLPDLPAKGGVDDWLPAGGNAEALYDLMDANAKPFEAEPFKTMFGAVQWLDFDAPGPTYDYLVKGVLTKGEQSMLLGESGSGKSFLAIDIAMAVARGVDWFGRKTRRGGVIYQAGESAVGVRRRRFPAYRQKYDVARDPLPVVLLERPVDLFNSDDEADQFIEECLYWSRTFPLPLELIVIDTFNKATPGANENDGKDMGTVLARCDKIRRATGAHVLLVHHLNAGGTKARGHTSLFANVENVVTVRKVENSHDGDGRQIREWTISKQKDGEDNVKKKFVLPAVEIGIDRDGDKITSCIVQPPNADGLTEAEKHDGISVGGMNAVVLRAIYTAVAEQGLLAPAHLALSRGAMAVERKPQWQVIRSALATNDDPNDIRDGETEEQASKRRAAKERQVVKRARDFLYTKKIIGSKDEWTWLTGRRVRGFEPPPGLGDAAGGSSRRAAALPSPDQEQVADLPFDVQDFE